MPFFELAAIVTVVLGLPSIVFYNVRRILEARYRSRAAGDGLPLSELQAMIESAVAEATEPLRRELEQLHSPAAIELPSEPAAKALLDRPEPVSAEP